VVFAVLPAHAAASTQVGQTVPLGAGTFTCSPPFTGVQDVSGAGAPGYTVPFPGILTSYSTQAGSGPGDRIRLEVFKATSNPTMYTVVGQSAASPPLKPDVLNSFPIKVPVQQGDLLGLTGLAGVVPVCSFTNVAGDQLHLGAVGDPPLNSTVTLLTQTPGERLNIAATLERDANCDGLGDETQETNVSGGCLPAQAARSLSKRARSRGKNVKLRFECALNAGNCSSNRVTLTGTAGHRAAAAAKGRKLGTASFSLAAGVTESKKVKLTRAGRRLLAARGKIKTKLTVSAPSGATTSRRLTIKLIR
jgi:hypothetical protein